MEDRQVNVCHLHMSYACGERSGRQWHLPISKRCWEKWNPWLGLWTQDLKCFHCRVPGLTAEKQHTYCTYAEPLGSQQRSSSRTAYNSIIPPKARFPALNRFRSVESCRAHMTFPNRPSSLRWTGVQGWTSWECAKASVKFQLILLFAHFQLHFLNML